MTTLWTNDVSILINKLSEIYPDKDYDLNRMVNAIVRFCIICIVVLVLTNQANKNIIGILLITIVLSTLYAMEQANKNFAIDTNTQEAMKQQAHPLQEKVDSQEYYVGSDGIKYWKAFPNVPYTKNIFKNMNASLSDRLKAVGLESAYPLENNSPEFYKYLYEVDMGMKKTEPPTKKGEIGSYDLEIDDVNFMNVSESPLVFGK